MRLVQISFSGGKATPGPMDMKGRPAAGVSDRKGRPATGVLFITSAV